MWRLPRTSGSEVLPAPPTALFLTVASSLYHFAPTQVPVASSPGLLSESSLAEDSIFDYSIMTRPLHPLTVSVFNYVRDATQVGRLNQFLYPLVSRQTRQLIADAAYQGSAVMQIKVSHLTTLSTSLRLSVALRNCLL